MPGKKPLLFTIGHSTRSLDELVALLRKFGVQRLVDVRTVPRSRHNPQFNRDALSKSLHNRRLNYRHIRALGGLRHARPNSPNAAWRNMSFRGYADYMQTPEFTEGLGQLMDLAQDKPAAIMCAEAVPWRCHRSLIADALIVRGYEVRDIMSVASAKLHKLSPMARVEGTRITYPGEETSAH